VQAQRAERRDDVTFDHRAGEVVHRMFALEPARMLGGVLLEREPPFAATVADHDNRARAGRGRAQLRLGAERVLITRDRNRADQGESAPLAGGADELQQIGHQGCNPSAITRGMRFFASLRMTLRGSRPDPGNKVPLTSF